MPLRVPCLPTLQLDVRRHRAFRIYMNAELFKPGNIVNSIMQPQAVRRLCISDTIFRKTSFHHLAVLLWDP